MSLDEQMSVAVAAHVLIAAAIVAAKGSESFVSTSIELHVNASFATRVSNIHVVSIINMCY